MKTQVAVGETDDPGFIAVLNSLVQGLISNRAPEELWIIQIDNWFDHKWLRFSGMGGVASPFLIGGLVTPYDSVRLSSIKTNLRFHPSLRTECWACGLTSESAMTTEKHRFPRSRIAQSDNAAR
jgi:hypothetical protein